ncbi:hypothetical protein PACTADRAFT_185389 [Pachysolen tannophilus NRRL Y-2460]|uniref:Mitochondrial distribution and morphology protein 10 n=1 Tax=Pachysolen tannophilus NRRL Y-2460 TaxID=669874 RepID=A0A1E4U2F5_PACTA|nr:hypothetical protein PACTADRAFT_185389 [Pachysolen tannophilus NRRL Y-2460]
MIGYMDYVEKCFYSTTNWNIDNLTENILSTSENLINFKLPKGFKFDISSNSTDYNYSSLSLSNNGKLSGSLAYLYCSKKLKIVNGTKNISLQEAIDGYRVIENPLNNYDFLDKKRSHEDGSLLYGRMHFPTRALEAMMIKRLSPTSQFTVKCINLPKQVKNQANPGIITFYYQNDFGKYSREFIFSSNEALMGFRFLYNIGSNKKNFNSKNNTSGANTNFNTNNSNSFDSTIIKNFHMYNSMLSLGTEVWYGALNMSPGLSSSLRYATHSTSTGKPLTMTLSCNPILGNISSSYSVKTSVSSTFCSKYDFNIYSYESNLSLGCELWKFSHSKNPKVESDVESRRKDKKKVILENINGSDDDFRVLNKSFPILNDKGNKKRSININRNNNASSSNNNNNNNNNNHNNKNNNFKKNNNNSSSEDAESNDVIATFSKLVSDSDFSSVIKASTSLKDKNLKLLWQGRFNGFLLSGGCCISFREQVPQLPVVGLQVQYSS